MGNTTSNQKRVVATKGTPHIPKTTGATDVGIDPCTGATAPFPNQVQMSLLTPGTSKTFIADKPIWTQPHQVGPSSEPSKAPFVIGQKSGTHIAEAKATSYSGDVIAEGSGVVRTNDTTTQNHANTMGFVDGSALDGKPNADEDFLKGQCTITELTGINEADGEAPPGWSGGKPAPVARPLGYPGRKQAGVPPFYIEILSSTEVKLKATRKDVTKPKPENPTCWKQGVHTKWLAKRTGEGATEAKPEEGKDDYVVTKALTGLTFGDGDRWYTPSSSTAGFNKNELLTAEQFNERASKKNKGNNDDVSITEKSKTTITGAASIEAVFAYWLYRNNPVNVNVQAISCAGSRNVQIRLFPAQKVNVEVNFSDSVETTQQTERRGAGKRAMAAALKAVSKLREAGKIAEKIAELAQKKVKISFLVETKVAFELSYKPCTEEKKGFWGNIYTPAHVGLPWKLTLTAQKFLGFDISISVSLLNLLGPYMETAASALRALGIKVDLLFTASLNLPINFSVGQDEYDYWTNTGIEVAIKPTLALYIDIATGISLIKFGAKFPASLSALFTGGDKPNVVLQLQPKGELRTILVLIIFEDSWFENSWEKDVEALRVNWVGPKIDVWTRS